MRMSVFGTNAKSIEADLRAIVGGDVATPALCRSCSAGLWQLVAGFEVQTKAQQWIEAILRLTPTRTGESEPKHLALRIRACDAAPIGDLAGVLLLLESSGFFTAYDRALAKCRHNEPAPAQEKT